MGKAGEGWEKREETVEKREERVEKMMFFLPNSVDQPWSPHRAGICRFTPAFLPVYAGIFEAEIR